MVPTKTTPKKAMDIITTLLQAMADTDEKLNVRIVTRNTDGAVITAKHVPISFVKLSQDSPTLPPYTMSIVIEQEDIDNAKEEPKA